jgi:hypothetical protein
MKEMLEWRYLLLCGLDFDGRYIAFLSFFGRAGKVWKGSQWKVGRYMSMTRWKRMM